MFRLNYRRRRRRRDLDASQANARGGCDLVNMLNAPVQDARPGRDDADERDDPDAASGVCFHCDHPSLDQPL
jgi:hypothetical protein